MNPLVYYCVGRRAENFSWFAKSLGTLRLHSPDVPVAVICDRDMIVDDPNVTVYRWPMRIVLDSMIARAFILQILPKAPWSLLYVDTDTAFCQPISKIIDACPLPGFWATIEPARICYIGSEMSGKYSMTQNEIKKATAVHRGSTCSGVWYTDVETAAKLFKSWTVETYQMAARHRGMTEKGDWRTGDQATLNAIIWRGELKVNGLDWKYVRPFAPPYYYYKPDRAPVISHFSGDAAVKKNIWSYPGDPIKLQFPRGQDPFLFEEAKRIPLEISQSESYERPKAIPVLTESPRKGTSMKTALVTAIVRDESPKTAARRYDATGFSQIVAMTRPTHEAYAKRIGADFRIITDRISPEIDVSFEKRQIWRLLEYEKYDRIIFVDADAAIRQDACSLFDLIPEGKLGILNEGIGSLVHERWVIELMDLGGKPRGWQWDGWYVNTGVMVIDRAHRDLFKDKPLGQQAHFRFGDQGYLNWYLQTHGGIPLYRLPKEFNWMPVANPGIAIAEVAKRAYIVHASMFPLTTRLKILDDVLAEWSNAGLF